MALRRNIDYVIAPEAVVKISGVGGANDKGCFVGTKTHLYLIPNAQDVDEGFWKSVLSDTYKIESLHFGEKTPAQVVLELLTNPESTLESIHEFFVNLDKTWESTEIVEIASLSKLKVSTMCGGSLAFRKRGGMIYTPFIFKIGAKVNHEVKAFYAEIDKQIGTKQ